MADIQFDEDALFSKYVEQAKTFGHKDEALQNFVEKKLAEARDRHERHLERESKKEMQQKEIQSRKEKEQLDREMQEKKEKLDRELQLQIEKEKQETLRLEIGTSTQSSGESSGVGPSFVRRQNLTLPKLPNFKDKTDDIDSYLYRFEANATAQGFNRDIWPLVLSSHLEGAALSLYHSLADGGSLTYESLRENLCKKFRCTAEGYRKRYRDAKPSADESFDIYSVELKRLLDRWITLGKVEKTFEGVVDMLLSEQLMQSVCKDLKVFLIEKNSTSFEDKVAAAESFRLAHPEKVMARKSDGSFLFASVNVREHEDEEEKMIAFSNFHLDEWSQPQYGIRTRGQRGGRNVRRFRFGGESRGQVFGQSSYRGNFRGGSPPQSSGNRYFGDRRFGSGGQSGFTQNSGFQKQHGAEVSGGSVWCMVCKKPGHVADTCRFGPNSDNAKLCPMCGFHHVNGFCPNHGVQAGMSCQQIESDDPTRQFHHCLFPEGGAM